MPSIASNHFKTQVLIIGAGPTGLSMATQLLRQNIDFIIIEKNAATTLLSKALAVQARTLEIFRELGLADKAIHTGKIATAMNILSDGIKKTAIPISNLGQGLSPYPYALSLEQSKTERLLADYLRDHNKQIRWNCTVSSIEQTDAGVTVYYKNIAGQECTVEAAYAVGCDGAGSGVRQQLGLPFEGSTEPRLFFVADVLLKSDLITADELYLNLIKKGFVLFFPMEGSGHYRIVGVWPDVKDMEQQFEFADVVPSFGAINTKVQFEKLNWFSTYKVHTRKAAAFIKGRCFIAGDAAHIHTPAGGQGMNTGIQDAYNLAWKFAYCLRGEAHPDLLETYSTERSANARRLLQTTDRMFDLISGDRIGWNFLRLTLLPILITGITHNRFIQQRMFPLISQTGIRYEDPYLTTKSERGRVKAGCRMPYFVFSDGSVIFDHLTAPVFKWIYFGDRDSAAAVKEPDVKLKCIVLHFNEVPQRWFKNERNFYILLRPDNHIAYIGKDRSKCEALLNRVVHGG
ncbi:MAG: FAD-dependent monooxygenase [Niabella sp.]|nr:FAD-dependent monooxygenase [Niabella sp.]